MWEVEKRKLHRVQEVLPYCISNDRVRNSLVLCLLCHSFSTPWVLLHAHLLVQVQLPQLSVRVGCSCTGVAKDMSPVYFFKWSPKNTTMYSMFQSPVIAFT